MSCLVLCGSFNPMTTGHVKLAELGYEYVTNELKEKVTKILFSPVHQKYPYKKLLDSTHRIQIAKLSISNSPLKDLMDINYDEVSNKIGYQPTFQVLTNLKNKIQQKIYLICGVDLVQGFLNPNYWPQVNVEKLMSAVEIISFLRSSGKGSVVKDQLVTALKQSYMIKYIPNIHFVDQEVSDASSTDVRSGNYSFLFQNVVKYIDEQKITWSYVEKKVDDKK